MKMNRKKGDQLYQKQDVQIDVRSYKVGVSSLESISTSTAKTNRTFGHVASEMSLLVHRAVV